MSIERVEIVDYTTLEEPRTLIFWNVDASFQVYDDGKILRVFIGDKRD